MAVISNSTIANTEFTPGAAGVFRFYNTGKADITLNSARAAGAAYAKIPDIIRAGTVVEVNNPIAATVYKWASADIAAAAYADQ